MVVLDSYSQEKIETKKNIKSTCDLKLINDENFIVFYGSFNIESIYQKKKHTTVYYDELKLDISNGEFQTIRKVNIGNSNKNKTVVGIKKNDFKSLSDFCDSHILTGEKNEKFWGVKYYKTITNIGNIIKTTINDEIKDEYIKNKIYPENYSLYEIIIDFYLEKHLIKPHNNVYYHINFGFPKNKWLKLNDRKFLPSLLDQFGIKSKYLISVLSSDKGKNINLKTLNYISHLFGDNHVDYIKKINWVGLCNTKFSPSEKHTLLDDVEKKSILNLLIKESNNETILEDIYKLVSLREHLKKKKRSLKIKIKNYDELLYFIEVWKLMKSHLILGYESKYDIPKSVITDLTHEIIIDNKVFKPKILLSELDFILEGLKMKNCMGKQFTNGLFCLYFSLSLNDSSIDLCFQNGVLTQGFGKGNTPIEPEIFGEPLEILKKRITKYSKLTWKKIKKHH